jgi:hypothetical protein
MPRGGTPRDENGPKKVVNNPFRSCPRSRRRIRLLFEDHHEEDDLQESHSNV